jgi:predicted metal-binding protein
MAKKQQQSGWPLTEKVALLIDGNLVALAAGTLVAIILTAGSSDADYLQGKITVAMFYAEHILPKAQAYRASVEAGAVSTMELPEELF